ncbi:hypothetical protein NC652_011251 [Populus alba x Populus x berolinensis]|uniref:Uncharacterized protein n=1 Tax=Populus alba x Populus x berolinensis TaxID=444605 RepID=A0AAD6R2Z5_9ROSI|nr:hypothetical protein NC651_011032 [Populus alba x Populus x berolinensis]KAJ6936484.1 hypothetical protein NC652_011251 [Populus alba x Populus x berolinensis]KAJ7000805.1 hypothetical protein NC653_011304 [Populus alba x Populus x berolinensis]
MSKGKGIAAFAFSFVKFCAPFVPLAHPSCL